MPVEPPPGARTAPTWESARTALFAAFPGAQVEDWVTPEGGEPRLVQSFVV